MDECFGSRIRMQACEFWIGSQESYASGSIFVSPLKPVDALIVVPKARID